MTMNPKFASQDGYSPQKFTSILRMTSGQDAEPDVILIEHSYARPYNWQPESSTSRPLKTLFISKLPRTESDDVIDVEKDNQTNSNIPPYDLTRGKHLMSECERHVVFAKLNRIGVRDDENDEDRDNTDWEELVIKTGWTETQHNLFNRIVQILDADRLTKLTLKDTVNEPIKRRAQIDKTAAKFRQSLGRVNWDYKLTHWLHNTLINNLSTPYLATYLDILQTLKSKIPNLVDKMISLSTTQKGPNTEALNFLLKRPWDPAVPLLNEQKPCKMENLPIVIQVPSGTTSTNVPQNSRRIRFFNSQLQHLVKFVPVSVTSDTADPGSILEQLMGEVQMRVVECQAQFPSHPIVLLGWGVGAILACYVSLIEKVSANVCLGFPMEDHRGKRGEPDDPLLGMITPTLFLIGEKATNAVVEDLEKFRSEMKAETSLVVIAGTDQLLKMSVEKRYWDGLTQSMVDRCIVEEIGDFLTRTFTEDNNKKPQPGASSSVPSGSHSQPASSSLTINTPPMKVTKKELTLPRKRKLSPSPLTLSETSHGQPAKLMRTGGTAISQNLGLKIPVGISCVASLMKPESSKTFSSFHLGTEDDFPSADGENFGKLDRSKGYRGRDDSSTHRFKFATATIPISEIASTSKQNPFASLSSASDVNSPSILTLGSGSALPVATISLGSLASLTRQRYQQMIQSSESSDVLTYSNNSSGRSSNKNLEFRTYSKASDGDFSNADVDICGLSSVATATAGATVPHSSLESAFVSSVSSGGEARGGNLLQDDKHGTTKSLISRRGRPPGKVKGSATTKGRGKEQDCSSMAVLTLTGAVGDGTGVEAAGQGISSLGRGVLTLSKGGTSTVRVYSASGQKINTSSNLTALPVATIQTGVQKSRGLYLTNISTAPAPKNENNNTNTIQGRIIASNKLISTDDAKKTTTVVTSVAAGQATLNLQGISASRAVPFGTTRPTVMLLSSTVPSSNSVGTTSTTTTISSGGLKTTKSIIGVKTTAGLKSLKETKFTIITEEDKSDLIQDDREIQELNEAQLLNLVEKDVLGYVGERNEADLSASSGSLVKLLKDSSDHSEVLEGTTVDAISTPKTQKTIVLGTKLAPSPSKGSTMTSNITFISSKALNKVFSSSSSETIQVKPHLQANTTYLKVPSKSSSIRLVRSVSGIQPSGANVPNAGSKGNIITKTFTIGGNAGQNEGSPFKRRISLDSRIKTVTKRSRGTSTDNLPVSVAGSENSMQSSDSNTEANKPDIFDIRESADKADEISDTKRFQCTKLKFGDDFSTCMDESLLNPIVVKSESYSVKIFEENAPPVVKLVSSPKDQSISSQDHSFTGMKEVALNSQGNVTVPSIKLVNSPSDNVLHKNPSVDAVTGEKTNINLLPKNFVTPLLMEPVALITSVPKIEDTKSKSEPKQSVENIGYESKSVSIVSETVSEVTTELAITSAKDPQTNNSESLTTVLTSDNESSSKKITNATSPSPQRGRRESVTSETSVKKKSKGDTTMPDRVTRLTIKNESRPRRLRSSF